MEGCGAEICVARRYRAGEVGAVIAHSRSRKPGAPPTCKVQSRLGSFLPRHVWPERRRRESPIIIFSNSWQQSSQLAVEHPPRHHTRIMAAIKRKAEQGSTPAKKDKGASGDRSAKRRKSDAAAEQPPAAKPKAEPPKSIFKDEEKAFPRGGASVLTPLEHKQIQIKANQDVLFEQAGGKRTKGGDDGFSDMGSEDDEDAAQKASKKKLFKKSKKSNVDGEKEQAIRVEGLSYKVRPVQRIASHY